MSTAFIVLPTYNEAKNIETVIPQIFKNVIEIPDWQVSILVVDDHSPDGTGNLVRALQKKYPDLHLLEGQKEGLGKAYIRGFRWVLEQQSNTDYIFEMDADLSHHPEYLPKFLAAAEQGYDFIIGSRYIPGGSCPDWSWHRKILSAWGNRYIRWIGGITKAHDCTSGYRCIALSLLRKMNLDRLLVKGYAFQMSLLDQAIKKDANVKEIPIVFTDRKEGKSKIGKNDLIECLITATGLRWRKY